MKRYAIQAHRSNYPNPISFAAGDRLVVDQRESEYPGWTWVRTADGNAGWAPVSYFEIVSKDQARATQDYTARELDTDIGDALVVMRELNGWYWLCNGRGEEGWAPVETTSEIHPEGTS